MSNPKPPFVLGRDFRHRLYKLFTLKGEVDPVYIEFLTRTSDDAAIELRNQLNALDDGQLAVEFSKAQTTWMKPLLSGDVAHWSEEYETLNDAAMLQMRQRGYLGNPKATAYAEKTRREIAARERAAKAARDELEGTYNIGDELPSGFEYDKKYDTDDEDIYGDDDPGDAGKPPKEIEMQDLSKKDPVAADDPGAGKPSPTDIEMQVMSKLKLDPPPEPRDIVYRDPALPQLHRWEQRLREKLLEAGEVEKVMKKPMHLIDGHDDLKADIDALSENLPKHPPMGVWEYWDRYLAITKDEPFPLDTEGFVKDDGHLRFLGEDPDDEKLAELPEGESKGTIGESKDGPISDRDFFGEGWDEMEHRAVDFGPDTDAMIELARQVGNLPAEFGPPPGGTIAVSDEGFIFLQKANFTNWLKSTAKGMAQGYLIIGPILSALDKQIPGMSGFLGTALNLYGFAASGGDPTGLIITAGIKLIQAYTEQARKVKENLTPGRDRGKKIGYVRDGDRWIPAVFNTRLQDTGLWAGHETVTAQTGEHIMFTMDPTSGADLGVQPVVFNTDASGRLTRPGHKVFTMSDAEYNNKPIQGTFLKAGVEFRYDADDPTSELIRPGSRQSVENYDMLRNWYFLSPAEMDKLTKGTMTLASYTQDTSKYNPYEKQVDDWRKVAGLMATGGTADALLGEEMSEWDVSGELRNAVTSNSKHVVNFDDTTASRMQVGKSAVLMSSNDGGARQYAQTYDQEKLGFAGLDADGYTDKVVKDNDFYRWEMPENDWLLNDMFTKQMKLLQRTQLAAATESKFKDHYYSDPYRDYHKDFYVNQPKVGSTGTNAWDAPSQTEEYNPIWASLYLDTRKSMATASSYDELQKQVDTINAYDDRTPVQKQYLIQKSITRYWMDQIGQRGGGQQLIDKVYSKTNDITSMKSRLNNAAYDYTRVHDESALDDQPWENNLMNSYFKDMSGTPGWVMPWQNADEGILPDDMHLPELSDWYKTNIERLGDEARENTSSWIEEHGKWNPNLLADGHLVSNKDHDIMDDYDYDDGKDVTVLNESDVVRGDLDAVTRGHGEDVPDATEAILRAAGLLGPKKPAVDDAKPALVPLTRKQEVQKGIKARKLRERKLRMMNRYWDSLRDKSKLLPIPYSGRTKQELAAQMAEIRKWQLAQDEAGVPPIVAPVVPVPPVQPVPPLPVSHPDPPKFTRPGPLRTGQSNRRLHARKHQLELVTPHGAGHAPYSAGGIRHQGRLIPL